MQPPQQQLIWHYNQDLPKSIRPLEPPTPEAVGVQTLDAPQNHATLSNTAPVVSSTLARDERLQRSDKALSGFKGVTATTDGKFLARVGQEYLGAYESALEAARARRDYKDRAGSRAPAPRATTPVPLMDAQPSISFYQAPAPAPWAPPPPPGVIEDDATVTETGGFQITATAEPVRYAAPPSHYHHHHHHQGPTGVYDDHEPAPARESGPYPTLKKRHVQAPVDDPKCGVLNDDPECSSGSMFEKAAASVRGARIKTPSSRLLDDDYLP